MAQSLVCLFALGFFVSFYFGLLSQIIQLSHDLPFQLCIVSVLVYLSWTSHSQPFAPPLKLTASINVSKRDFKDFKQIQAEIDTHKIGLHGMPRSLLKWQA